MTPFDLPPEAEKAIDAILASSAKVPFKPLPILNASSQPVRLGSSFFYPHRVRGSELIARTIMRSPWPAGQWTETKDESGTVVEISCRPPCWFELLPESLTPR